ncbi:MAG: hypothetical protein ACK56F_16175, partial [bacterium]
LRSWRVLGSASMSLEETRSWQVEVYHSAVARGHEERARSSSWVACVRLFANISICEAGPDPLERREHGAALSEKHARSTQNSTRPGSSARYFADAETELGAGPMQL